MTKHSDDIRRGLRNPVRFKVPLLGPIEVHQDGEWCRWSEVEPLLDEIYVLRNKVEWLRQADRLVVWNGTEWRIRHELDGKSVDSGKEIHKPYIPNKHERTD